MTAFTLFAGLSGLFLSLAFVVFSAGQVGPGTLICLSLFGLFFGAAGDELHRQRADRRQRQFQRLWIEHRNRRDQCSPTPE